MCNSFRNILSKWISNFILPQLHHLYFLLYELFPTARMSEFFYWLVNLMCFATILLIMKLYVCQVSYSYIIPDLFYYLHSRCLLESLNSWLLPLGYPDFGAVWWFNSLSLSLSLVYRSMKSRILATYPDAFADDSKGDQTLKFFSNISQSVPLACIMLPLGKRNVGEESLPPPPPPPLSPFWLWIQCDLFFT